MRYFLLILALLVVMTVILVGTRGSISRKPPIELFPDMVRQPKYRPQGLSEFYPDKMASRLPVDGTIARAEPVLVAGKAVFPFDDAPFNTGRHPGTTNFIDTNPLPITEGLLARGQERFGIYCAPCHGAVADGKGITVKWGMTTIADLHDVKVRKVVQQTDGELFNTVTHGKNLMQPYGPLISVSDRWAIIAYVRALQRSRLATMDDVPANERNLVPNPPPPAAQPATAPAPAQAGANPPANSSAKPK